MHEDPTLHRLRTRLYALLNHDKIVERRQANREATNARQRANYAKHQDIIKALRYAKHRANPEKRREQERAWRAANRERYLANQRASYARNKAKRNAECRTYFQSHRDTLVERNKAWKQANPERLRQAENLYYHTHKQQVIAKHRRHRALKNKSPRNDLTAIQWQYIQEMQDHRCAYCHKRCKGHLTQDHITPLSKGGAHTLHNVVGACRACNSKKHIGAPLTPVQPLLL